MTNTYIDIHVIQSVPPSNLNRDDAGSPKQAVFGGVRRARVSSQAWKRATRKYFSAQEAPTDEAVRTRQVAGLLQDRLVSRGAVDTELAARIAEAVVKNLGISKGKKEANTAYLLFFGMGQLDAMVDKVVERLDDLSGLDGDALEAAVKELEVKDLLKTGHPLEVALFGRMVADVPSLNVDAATQVAHAISTHAVDIEFDYFTAVDDRQEADDDADAGAGMIGTVEFNSATLYRYATLGLSQLSENLGGDVEATADGVARFVEGFARSMPTGHENAFAHRTLPSLVAVVVRDDQPVNLVSAFEDPIWSTGGLVGPSTVELAKAQISTQELWGGTPVLVAGAYSTDEKNAPLLAEAFGEPRAFDDVVDEVRRAVSSRLTGGEG